MNNPHILRFCSLGLLFALLAGCQVLPEPKADPTRYFVLTGPASTEKAVARPMGRLQIGIRAIEVAGYLHNQRDIAIRTGTNELRYEEFNRWAEPLETGINRVLRQRLLSLEGIGGVLNYPFATDLKRDYDIIIRVLSCEGAVVAGGRNETRFVVAYDIISAGTGGQVLVRRTFTAPEQTWDGADFGALAALLSEAVARLSEDIASNLPN